MTSAREAQRLLEQLRPFPEWDAGLSASHRDLVRAIAGSSAAFYERVKDALTRSAGAAYRPGNGQSRSN